VASTFWRSMANGGLLAHGIDVDEAPAGLGNPPLVQAPYVLVGHVLGECDQGRRELDGMRALAALAASRYVMSFCSSGGSRKDKLCISINR
jgi:hypothetical protein